MHLLGKRINLKETHDLSYTGLCNLLTNTIIGGPMTISILVLIVSRHIKVKLFRVLHFVNPIASLPLKIRKSLRIQSTSFCLSSRIYRNLNKLVNIKLLNGCEFFKWALNFDLSRKYMYGTACGSFISPPLIKTVNPI